MAYRPYPRVCGNCWEEAIWPATMPYEVSALVDGVLRGRLIPQLPIDKCGMCGEIFFSNETDDCIEQTKLDMKGACK